MLSKSIKNIKASSWNASIRTLNKGYSVATKDTTIVNDKAMDKSVLTFLKENQQFQKLSELPKDFALGPQDVVGSRLNVFLLFKLLKQSRANSNNLQERFPTLKELNIQSYDELYLSNKVQLSEEELELEKKIYNLLKTVYDVPTTEKNEAIKMGPNVKIEHGVGYGIQKQAYGTNVKVTDQNLKYFLSSEDPDVEVKHGTGLYQKLLYGLNKSEQTINSGDVEKIIQKIHTSNNIFKDSFKSEENLDANKTTSFSKNIRKFNYNNFYLSKLGCTPENIFDMEKNIYSPKSYTEVTVEDLMLSQCHLGESASLKHPYNKHFIYDTYKPNIITAKNNEGDISIIDSNKTLQSLKRSCQFLSDAVSKGAFVLVVGNDHGLAELTLEMASQLQGSAVTETWSSGALTNINSLKFSKRAQSDDVRSYKFVDSKNNLIGYENLSEYQKKQFKTKERLPDIIIFLKPSDTNIKGALNEAKRLNIPVIGLCDTDINHNFFDYAIPCNDDSIRSVTFVGGVLAKAGHAGLLKRQAGLS
ncbi:hypothetical protein FOG51_00551 [Hanseniaspora uvarum]|nr:hypothetical protein FOG48_02881 [Hanseniaspora uvarum]KAF0274533.1 hypothetical protein FOG51_00551 [Hanseniaspora uvarum]GMM40178.1 mitochondrial 37S ribosomal protein [Hanseniaspora uvarum]